MHRHGSRDIAVMHLHTDYTMQIHQAPPLMKRSETVLENPYNPLNLLHLGLDLRERKT